MSEWNYLDKYNANLLYEYCDSILKGQNLSLILEISRKRSDITEAEKLRRREIIKKNAYYLVWFVYRYVLQCETLEEALRYADEDTFQRFSLTKFLKHGRGLYIGCGEYSFWFDSYPANIEDNIRIVLEILYHQLVGIEQFVCALKYLKGNRRAKCQKMYETLLTYQYLREGVVL